MLTQFISLPPGSFSSDELLLAIDHTLMLAVHPQAYESLDSPTIGFTIEGRTSTMRAHGVLLQEDMIVVDLYGHWESSYILTWHTAEEYAKATFAGLLLVSPSHTGILLACDTDNDKTADLHFAELLPHLMQAIKH